MLYLRTEGKHKKIFSAFTLYENSSKKYGFRKFSNLYSGYIDFYEPQRSHALENLRQSLRSADFDLES